LRLRCVRIADADQTLLIVVGAALAGR